MFISVHSLTMLASFALSLSLSTHSTPLSPFYPFRFRLQINSSILSYNFITPPLLSLSHSLSPPYSPPTLAFLQCFVFPVPPALILHLPHSLPLLPISLHMHPAKFLHPLSSISCILPTCASTSVPFPHTVYTFFPPNLSLNTLESPSLSLSCTIY